MSGRTLLDASEIKVLPSQAGWSAATRALNVIRTGQTGALVGTGICIGLNVECTPTSGVELVPFIQFKSRIDKDASSGPDPIYSELYRMYCDPRRSTFFASLRHADDKMLKTDGDTDTRTYPIIELAAARRHRGDREYTHITDEAARRSVTETGQYHVSLAEDALRGFCYSAVTELEARAQTSLGMAESMELTDRIVASHSTGDHRAVLSHLLSTAKKDRALAELTGMQKMTQIKRRQGLTRYDGASEVDYRTEAYKAAAGQMKKANDTLLAFEKEFATAHQDHQRAIESSPLYRDMYHEYPDA